MPFALRLPRRGGPAMPAPASRPAPPVGRDLADLVAPAAVERSPAALRLERELARTLAVTGYPRSVGPGWLAPLLGIGLPIEVSMHLDPQESGAVQSALARKLVQLESSRRLADRGGRLAD